MILPQGFTGFCVFCYQSIYICAKAVQSSESVVKFTKFVSKYTVEKGLNKLVRREDEPDTTLKLQCCNECNIIIDGFCKYYHQFEVLELQMNYKLKQIAKIIKHCNRVPSRWTKMNVSLEETFPNDVEMSLKTQDRIRKYRSGIEETCHKRNLLKQPRVLLEMNIDLRNSSGMSHLCSKNDNKENDVTSEGSINNVASPMASDMEIEADMSGNDDDEEVSLDDLDQDESAPVMDPTIQVKLEAPAIQVQSDSNDIVETEIENYQPNDNGATNLTDDRTEIDISESFTTTSVQPQQRYSLRNKRKSEALKFENANSSDNDSDAEFAPELRSEQNSSDNDSHISEIQEEEKRPNRSTSTTKRFKSTEPNHSEGEKLQCPKCEKSFNYLSALRKHMNSKFCPKFNQIDTESLKCDDCDWSFNLNKELWSHKKEDHGNIVCVECGKEFKSRMRLKIHSLFHKDSKEWKFKCCHCDKKFARNILLRSHMRTVHNDDNVPISLAERSKQLKFFTCGNCKKRFVNIKVLHTHIYSQANGKFQCEFCEHVEKNVLKLSTHEYQNHSSEEIKEQDGNSNSFQRTCPRCKFKSTSFAEYQYHFSRIHFKLKDQKCIKTKDDNSRLENRVSGVVIELEKLGFNTRSKKCEICDRIFQTYSHKVTHLKECHDLPGNTDKTKLFNCGMDNCTAYFVTVNQLNFHQYKNHNRKYHRTINNVARLKAAEDEIGSFKCEECNLICNSKYKLWVHRNEGHDQLICVKCGKVFGTRKKLNYHLLRHKDSSDWDWECCKCRKRCATTKTLNDHMRKKHNGSRQERDDTFRESVKRSKESNPNLGNKRLKRLFNCGKCYKRFRSEQNYQNHLYSQEEGNYKCEFCPHVETNVIKLSSHEYQSHCMNETSKQNQNTSESIDLSEWSCPRCKYKFSGCADYQCHFAKVHFKIKEPKCVNVVDVKSLVDGGNSCEKCGKGFTKLEGLRRHQKYFHSENKFTCENCGKGFTNLKALNRHLKTHKDSSD